MLLFRSDRGVLLRSGPDVLLLGGVSWDDLFRVPDLPAHLAFLAREAGAAQPAGERLLAPIERQEVWAAGVTYLRSRNARMEEAGAAGGGDFYDRVYEAVRPELFFKATAHRVAGPGEPVRVRRDSAWSVPEPELALAVGADGRIIGYTIGNDMSARDIEGENPLYLPQAKVYDGCCALGPGLLVPDAPLPASTGIRMRITRDGRTAFEGETTLAAMKRTPEELVSYLCREASFPVGCYLLTGTGIVPPDDFALRPGDRVSIGIEGIGLLENPVA